jgi:hypothetical protein
MAKIFIIVIISPLHPTFFAMAVLTQLSVPVDVTEYTNWDACRRIMSNWSVLAKFSFATAITNITCHGRGSRADGRKEEEESDYISDYKWLQDVELVHNKNEQVICPKIAVNL